MHVYNQESRSLVESLKNEFANSGGDRIEVVDKPVDHILSHHALRVICGMTCLKDLLFLNTVHIYFVLHGLLIIM